MTFETIKYSKQDNIAFLMMNRPKTHNAQNIKMLDEIDIALQEAAKDDEVRVLIFGGIGKSFSSGHDLKEMIEGTNPEYVKQREFMETRVLIEEDYYYRKCLNIRDFPKPIIAQVQGHCLAAGLMLASMCDIIVAAENAEFGNPVGRMAAIGVEILVEPWEVPIRIAKEMLFTGDSISAEVAYKHGMVNRVTSLENLESETLKLAEKIATMPPFALRMTKKSLNKTVDIMGQRDAWDHHFDLHQICHATQEWEDIHSPAISQKENLKDFLNKRDSAFKDGEK